MVANDQHRQPNGYQSEFIYAVTDLFFFCKLVARRLTGTGCCGESYMYACIADICDAQSMGVKNSAFMSIVKL